MLQVAARAVPKNSIFTPFTRTMATDTGVSRGAFIVFEGVDRCGKTTQAQKLVEALEKDGQSSKFMRFPDRSTPIGGMINEYLNQSSELDDHSVHLLFSANRWEKKKEIESLLTSGTHVIVDRYSFSGVAFSAAKDEMSFDWCAAPEYGLPQPDSVFFMEMEVEDTERRGGYGEERYENKTFQTKVKAQYQKLYDHKYWQSIPANRSIEECHEDVKKRATDIMSSVKNTPIKYLNSLASEHK
eukprot:gb/GECG01002310.1/.p1 GENE.gb/GECG01002310.1/~~gb/GECG01002310.1/.p1  ORF type:complete len:242 (+),score=38.55 gb/GECG01002310.1/:1-726(+)